MLRKNFNDLMAFIIVAREQSFTKAAARLGISQPALSYTIRMLESRLGLRLLTRTTRSVSPTEAGERLLHSLAPHFEHIEDELVAITELRDKPAGVIRITTGEHAAKSIIWPALRKILPLYPEIQVEIDIDYGMRDIVAERYDAGVRLGEQVAKDMIAVRIGPEMSMCVVGSPAYFAKHPRPQTPDDLTQHNCINLRLATHGNLYSWEFEKDGRELRVKVEGQLTLTSPDMIIKAAIDGMGLACLPDNLFQSFIKAGELERVLEDWCPPFPGYHLYYPSRRQHSKAFSLVVEALRY
jgi:DNA-binding transcriptional LysR family regulator